MQRVTITLDDELMKELDAIIAARGYQNRSEAIRDLARAGIRLPFEPAKPRKLSHGHHGHHQLKSHALGLDRRLRYRVGLERQLEHQERSALHALRQPRLDHHRHNLQHRQFRRAEPWL